MVGEPHYMAPEQISGQGYEYGVDYWSLGILIFVMLHIETPFASETSETQVGTKTVLVHKLPGTTPGYSYMFWFSAKSGVGWSKGSEHVFE